MVDGVLRIDLPTTNDGAEDATSSNLACFVAGPENRLSILALEGLITGEADFWPVAWANPLVLIGPSGCGKSLLTRGIVRRWLPCLGKDRVAYFTAIDFSRQLSDARAEERLGQFRSRLSKLQLLVIEDLQRLPAKSIVHQELRDLVDKLVDCEAVVIATSQATPMALPLEPGLGDRLAGGLLLWLNHPGFDARLELLRLATVDRGASIDERQLRTMAEAVAGPVPRLLGTLRELDVVTKVGAQPSALQTGLTAKEIVAVVARYFGLTQSALRGPARRKSLVFARNVAVYLIRTTIGASYSQIGRELGHRDHSTIMHSMETIQTAATGDSAIQHTLQELRRILLSA